MCGGFILGFIFVPFYMLTIYTLFLQVFLRVSSIHVILRKT